MKIDNQHGLKQLCSTETSIYNQLYGVELGGEGGGGGMGGALRVDVKLSFVCICLC